MTLRVTIHAIRDGQDTEVGVIEYDDDTATYTLDPVDDGLLQSIMRGPIFVSNDEGDLDDVRAEDEPTRFMENLCNHYRGHGVRASEPTEGAV